MIDFPVLDSTFAALHFGEARLGDVRRTRRLVLAAEALTRHPGGTLPQKFQDPAPLDAFYRLANPAPRSPTGPSSSPTANGPSASSAPPPTRSC